MKNYREYAALPYKGLIWAGLIWVWVALGATWSNHTTSDLAFVGLFITGASLSVLAPILYSRKLIKHCILTILLTLYSTFQFLIG